MAYRLDCDFVTDSDGQHAVSRTYRPIDRRLAWNPGWMNGCETSLLSGLAQTPLPQ